MGATMTEQAPIQSNMRTSTMTQREGTAGPSRNTSYTSRIGSALNRIPSIEAHPPAHAHFEIPIRPSPIHSHRGSHDDQYEGGDGDDRVDGVDGDKELRAAAAAQTPMTPVVDIEHVPCNDDPREWSNRKKNMVLGMMTISVLGPMIAPSIYNPVIDEIKAELHASDTQIGLSLSLYILLQGGIPIFWASTTEIFGRKPIYLISFALYTVAAIVASRAPNMATLIAMRCIQAIGSSSPVAIGAASLADMYEPHERGNRLGLFYGMPLLGPALGPLIGGALGNSFGWRSVLYFLAAFAGVVDIMFIFFPDTWRRERSRVYQKAIKNAVKRALSQEEANERKRQRKLSKGLPSNAPTPPLTQPNTRRQSTSEGVTGVDGANNGDTDLAIQVDTERNEVVVKKRRWWKRKEVLDEEGHAVFRPTVRDVNPFPTIFGILKSPTNSIMLFSSGLLFAAQYTIPYTASVTLAKAPYDYNALYIGIIILAFGIGNILGSIFGGRYSDRVLRRLKAANGGVSIPEMRLRSTVIAMPIIVASFLAYAWTAGEKVHIAGIIVSLVFCGLAVMVIYSSTLAYLVDSNPGRSAAAVSTNSLFRGSFACIMSQIAIPIQNAIGDGGLYSLIAGLLAISSAGILITIWKGETWRAAEHRWPWQKKVEVEKVEMNGVSSSVAVSTQ